MSSGFQRTKVRHVRGLLVMKVDVTREFSEKFFVEGYLKLNI